MAERKPVVLVGGVLKEMPSGDALPAANIPEVTAPNIHAAPSKTTPVDADELGLSDSAASWGLKKLTFANLKAVLLAYFKGQFREKLTAARTYYVRTDGNDSNTGLVNSSGGAFLTVQKAIDVTATLDLSIYQVTVKLGDGTYGNNIVPKNYVGDGPLVIEGNVTTPNNVVLSGTSGNLVQVSALKSKYTFRKLKVQTSGAGSSCFYVEKSSTLDLDGVNFGACVSVHILSADGSTVFVNSSYEVSGSAYAHWYASYASNIIVPGGATITLVGTPAFTVAWAFAPAAGNIRSTGITFSGGATGVRYNAALNSVIQTGGGATYLPGNAAGTTATGGQYA